MVLDNIMQLCGGIIVSDVFVEGCWYCFSRGDAMCCGDNDELSCRRSSKLSSCLGFEVAAVPIG